MGDFARYVFQLPVFAALLIFRRLDRQLALTRIAVLPIRLLDPFPELAEVPALALPRRPKVLSLASRHVIDSELCLNQTLRCFVVTCHYYGPLPEERQRQIPIPPQRVRCQRQRRR